MIKSTERELARTHSNADAISFKGFPFSKPENKIEVEKTRRCKKGEVAPCLGSYQISPSFKMA